MSSSYWWFVTAGAALAAAVFLALWFDLRGELGDQPGDRR